MRAVTVRRSPVLVVCVKFCKNDQGGEWVIFTQGVILATAFVRLAYQLNCVIPKASKSDDALVNGFAKINQKS
jgi:hypothetical protein